MRILDFYPSRGTYAPSEKVTFLIEVDDPTAVALKIAIQHLNDKPVVIERSFQSFESPLEVQWVPPAQPAGYSARLEIQTPTGELLSATTAFDVLSSWTDFPRYGFLSDFSASRADPDAALQNLTRFHINGLQFYDWQYRHDQLLAATDEYIDPLGREMSLGSVRQLVDAAHRRGMACMPYLAIYAASAEFWRAHPAWALYNEAGVPIAFGENFLGLMDPTNGTPWSEHLLAEGKRALQGIPFDGLHIDQYGDPKQAWNSHHEAVDLPRAFVDFIQSASDQHPHKTILFNAVGNWPIEALAESSADFMYIEIWPPDVEYLHVAQIVMNAVRRSGGKVVVIALYLPASRPANNLLADAVILACGGNRIELGETARLLSDPYFPKHEEIPGTMSTSLRRLSDFSVRNGEWLRSYPLSQPEKEAWADGELNPPYIDAGTSILTVARHHASSLTVQLVNFNGLDLHQRWDEEHRSPLPCKNLPTTIRLAQVPSHIFWDAPEQIEGPISLAFDYSNGTLTFRVPQLETIGLAVIHV